MDMIASLLHCYKLNFAYKSVTLAANILARIYQVDEVEVALSELFSYQRSGGPLQ